MPVSKYLNIDSKIGHRQIMENSEIDSYQPWSSTQPLLQVVPSVDEVSTKEKMKLLCKPTYRMRLVKTKGALLVLAWNFLTASVFFYIICSSFKRGILAHQITAGVLLFAITLPLAGWLADAYIGRYKIIYCSFLIMWAGIILDAANQVIRELVKNYQHIDTVVVQVLYGTMGIGIGGFLSTSLQLGIDQLYDASTNEISAFIIWYIWTYTCPLFIILNLPQDSIPSNFYLLGHLLLCVFLTLILASLFCCNNWLIKEPISQNPFKLIYRVTKYAIKNKYPQNRSAFIYCEDEVISRIDHGKSKYGGPFTIEQVEDVKTFYKILPLVILSGILAGEMMAAGVLTLFLKV